jgi:sarcosine oxidase subunit beta
MRTYVSIANKYLFPPLKVVSEYSLAEVIVIGGGIAGCSTAWYLASGGVDVLLLERGELNGLASGANAGSLHAQIQHEPFVDRGEDWARQYVSALPFYRFSIDLWEQAEEDLNVGLEFSRDGGIIVAASATQMRQIEAKSRLEQSAGLGTELLDRDGLRQIAPYISQDMVGGAFCPVEGKANPLLAAPAFATAAESLGATIISGCAVTGLRRDHDGFIVETETGDFSAPRVVDAAGTEVAKIAAFLGMQLDIQAFPIQLSVTEPVEELISHLVYSADDMLTLKQSHAGTILIGGGWPASIDRYGRPQICGESLSRNLALAMQVVPRLADALVIRSWAGVVNGTDSWLPILGETRGISGFYINYVPWMGFTGGPGGGRIVASLVKGEAPPVDFDLKPFAPGPLRA